MLGQVAVGKPSWVADAPKPGRRTKTSPWIITAVDHLTSRTYVQGHSQCNPRSIDEIRGQVKITGPWKLICVPSGWIRRRSF